MAAPSLDHGVPLQWSASNYAGNQKIRVSRPMWITGVSGKAPTSAASVNWGARLYSSAGTLLATSGAVVFRNVSSTAYCDEIKFATPYLLLPGVDYYAGLYGHYLGYYGGGAAKTDHVHTDGGASALITAASDLVRWGAASSDDFGTNISGIYEMAYRYHLVDAESSFITTAATSLPLGFGNQRAVDKTANGNRWVMQWDGTFATSDTMEFWVSADEGTTWVKGGSFGFAGTNLSYTPNASFFIDADDYAHVVYKDSHDGFIYYRRGTPNVGRTTWTWSAANVHYNGDALMDYPDVVAFSDGGTGWHVIVTASYRTGGAVGQVDQGRFTVNSGGTITLVGRAGISAQYSSSVHQWPSLDFHHTGDGKTVKGGTPHLYLAWSGGTSANGIRFRKAVFSGGSWTWNAERTIDTNRYIDGASRSLRCRYDSANDLVVIAGYLLESGAYGDLMVYDRDQADTTTTVRVVFDNAQGAPAPDQWNGGQIALDTNGDVIFVAGSNQTESTVAVRRWHRKGWHLGSVENIEAGLNVAPNNPVRIRDFCDPSEVDVAFRMGTVSPYAVWQRRLDLRPWITGPIQLSSTGTIVVPTEADYDAEVTADSPVARWRLDEESGTFANSVAGGQVGTAVGTFSRGAIGIPNGDKAVGFDGRTGAGITIPAQATLNVVGGLTIEAWIWVPTWDQSGFIFEKTTNGTVNTQYSLYLQATAPGRLDFRTVVGGTITADLAVYNPGWPTNEWVHIAATWNGTTKRLYVNGVDVGNIAFSGTLATGAGGSVIGAYGNPPAGYYFNGLIDEVAIYPTGLSQARVQAHYVAGLAKNISGEQEVEVATSYYSSGFDTWSDWSDEGTFAASAFLTRTADDTAPADDEATRIRLSTRTAEDDAPVDDAVTHLRSTYVSVEDAAGEWGGQPTRSLVGTIVQPVFGERSVISTSDEVTHQALLDRTAGDDAPVEEEATRTTLLVRWGDDSAPASDEVTSQASLSRSADDSAPASDEASRTAVYLRSVADSAPADDAPVRQVNFGRSATDATDATDVVSSTASLARTGSDTAAATDAATRLTIHPRVTGDDAPAVDDGTRWPITYARSGADSIEGLTDDAVRSAGVFGRSLDDSAPASDVATRATVHPRTSGDTAPATDTVESFAIQPRTVGDSAPASDALAHLATMYRSAGDTSPADDVAIREVALKIRTTTNDASTVDDGATRSVDRARTTGDDAPAEDAATQNASRSRQGTDDISGISDGATRTQTAPRTSDDAAPATDAATRTTVLPRTTGDVAPAEDGALRLTTHPRTSTDEAAATDEAIRTTVHPRAIGDDAPADDEAVQTSVQPRAAGDDAPATEEAVRVFIGERTEFDTASAADGVGHQVLLPRAVTDGAEVTEDVVTRTNGIFVRQADDAAPAVDDGTRWPLTLARSGEDTISEVADSVTRSGVFAREVADGAAGEDAVTHQTLLSRSADDDAPATESVSSAGLLLRTAGDSAPASDAVTHQAVLVRTGADTAPIIDEAIQTASRSRTAEDDVSLTDGASRLGVFGRLGDDVAPAADEVQSGATAFRTTDDIAPASDSPTSQATLYRSGEEDVPVTDGAQGLKVLVHEGEEALPEVLDGAVRITLQPRGATDGIPEVDDLPDRTLLSIRTTTDAAPGSDAASSSVLALRSASDTASISDGVVSSALLIRTTADSAPAGDALTHLATQYRSGTDVAPAADEVASLSIHPRGVTDTAGATDDATRQVFFTRAATDSVQASDEALRSTQYARVTDDTAEADDEAQRLQINPRASSDVIPEASDLVARQGTFWRVPDDSAPAVDDGTRWPITYARSGADSIEGVIDGAVRSAGVFTRVIDDLVPEVEDSAGRHVTFARTSVDEAPAEDLASRYAERSRIAGDEASADDVAVRSITLPRSVDDGAGGEDQVERLVFFTRDAQDDAEAVDGANSISFHLRAQAEWLDDPVDDASRLLWLPRIIGDVAPAQDGVQSLHIHRRDLSDVASADDSASRHIILRRTSEEGAPEHYDIATRALWVPRAAGDEAPAQDEGARVISLLRRLTDDATTHYDDWAYARVGSDYRLAVQVTITSVSRIRVSPITGYAESTVTFAFDQPVLAWSLRLGSTTHLDGRLIADWRGHPPTQYGIAIVPAALLQPGVNRLTIYGQALSGLWSR
jgi:hypothetical protein